ncbi:MAG TPA: HEPN domain-containing protein [Chitinophagaceae bacterium]|nr:HEPN domain-containing protein [Chitinophagaceae bacterium]
MRPFTIYHLFRDAFSSFLQVLVDIIVNAAGPDMIFLLGASLHRRRSESIFLDTAPSSRYLSDCFLLVLINDPSNRELHEWQDKIETRCKRIIPVTAIVLETATFKHWLDTGHRFADAVWESASCIYDPNNLGGSFATGRVDANDANRENQHAAGLAKAREFLAGSELFSARKQKELAAFMLHQSAEQALRTIIKTGTGYHGNTHSLDRLIRYGSLISYSLRDIFPQNTEQEKRLFNLLQKAYIEARYQPDYKISTEDLLLLMEKVKLVHEILSGMD